MFKTCVRYVENWFGGCLEESEIPSLYVKE
jgi:hypothetical protein